jgi:hypothetical protein
MLKIKMIMAALLAIGFAGQTFASEDVPPPPPPSKSSKTKPAHGGRPGTPVAGGPNAARKWTETGEELKAKCNDACTKNACKAAGGKGFDMAVACATNCRKVATFEIVDCVPMAYNFNCGKFADPAAKASAKATPADEKCLTLAKGNAAIMNKVYENRDNKASSQGGGKLSAEEAADESMAAFSREAKMWKFLKSIDTGNDTPAAG